MNCATCGTTLQDDLPHPPNCCAWHAGKELRRVKEALDGALETISRLTVERRGFQIMAKQMLGLDRDLHMTEIQVGRYERAGGDVECTACGRPYVEHPELLFPTFHLVCSGKIYKT